MALSAVINVLNASSASASRVIQDLTYTAVTPGSQGNSISVQYVDPGAPNQALSVSVLGNAITVNLATDGSSVLTSTATQIRTAVLGSAPAAALVNVVVSGTGSNVQTAQIATFLLGGSTTTTYNQKLVAVATVSNSGAFDLTLQTVKPQIINGLASDDNTGAVLGPDPVPTINPVVAPAGGSVIVSWPLIFLAPSAPGFIQFGSSSISYSVGAQIQATDGTIAQATAATVVVSSNS